MALRLPMIYNPRNWPGGVDEERALVDTDDARTIGRRLRRVRKSRGKSLAVIAGLAGMSKSQLDRIERGEVALDRLSEIVALANALQIAPGDLMRLPVPAPANGHAQDRSRTSQPDQRLTKSFRAWTVCGLLADQLRMSNRTV